MTSRKMERKVVTFNGLWYVLQKHLKQRHGALLEKSRKIPFHLPDVIRNSCE